MVFNEFDDYIAAYGDQILIVYRNPSIVDGSVVKDERGHTVYVEEEIETIARIKMMRGTETLVKNGVLQVGDATGLFSLTDYAYINRQSKVILKRVFNGQTRELIFNMSQPVEKKTHITANLKRVDL